MYFFRMYQCCARLLSLLSLLVLGLSLVLAQEGSGSLPAGEGDVEINFK